MKRIISLLITLAMIFSIVGCSDSEPQESSTVVEIIVEDEIIVKKEDDTVSIESNVSSLVSEPSSSEETPVSSEQPSTSSSETSSTVVSTPVPFTEPEKDGDVYTIVHTESDEPDWKTIPKEERLSNCVMIKEELTNGQSVESFSIYGYLPAYKHKKILLFKGKTIGHKVLCKFSPLRASKYEVIINQHDGDYAIKDIKAYYVK